MANLGDAFKKAGLISEKERKKQKHAERVRRKEVGHQGVLEAEEQARAAREARRDEQRERDRERERQRQQRHAANERRARAHDLMRTHGQPPPRGRRRWHYTVGKQVLFALVDDRSGRRLEAGEVGLVTRGNALLILDREHLKEVAELAPECVAFFNEEPA